MAFRLLRICDSEEKFECRLKELKNDFLIPRNYKSKLIDLQFNKVRYLPGTSYTEKRNLALKQQTRVKNYDYVIAINCKSENVIYIWKCNKCGHNFDMNKNINTNTHTTKKELYTVE